MNSQAKDLDTQLVQAQGECRELAYYKEQYERRYAEMARNHKIILKSLVEVTQKAESLSSDNEQLADDLRRISKKLVKTHLKTSIFNKYQDMIRDDP